uniref:Uncharacterized protein n=1 Tax=Arundo donax TaxID=35708 RepID=A0A0A9B2B1_ARUDO
MEAISLFSVYILTIPSTPQSLSMHTIQEFLLQFTKEPTTRDVPVSCVNMLLPDRLSFATEEHLNKIGYQSLQRYLVHYLQHLWHQSSPEK